MLTAFLEINKHLMFICFLYRCVFASRGCIINKINTCFCYTFSFSTFVMVAKNTSILFQMHWWKTFTLLLPAIFHDFKTRKKGFMCISFLPPPPSKNLSTFLFLSPMFNYLLYNNWTRFHNNLWYVVEILNFIFE